MEDNAKLLSSSSSSSITIFSRLDHLDYVMKSLEKKQRLERIGGRKSEGEVEKRCISLDVALKDTLFKGSLLDRVAALEHRLFQLCLEMENGSCSSNPSSLSSSAIEINCSSSPKQFSRGEPSSSSSSSYPTFHYPNHGRISQISQLQEKKPQRHDQEKKKQESCSKGQVIIGSSKKKTKDEEVVGSCKNVKKVIPPPKWPHLKLRMFGC